MMRRRARLAGLVATLAVLATTGLAGPATAAPSPVSVPRPAAAPTLGSHSADVKQRKVGQTATFSHLKVKVSSTSRKADSYFFGAKISVCVTSLPAGTTSLRLSWNPWRVNGTYRPGEFDEGQDPWGGHHARTDGYYRVGQCLKGWLPFAVRGTTNVTKISYANSLGNKVNFSVANGKSPQRTLGSTAKSTHYTVKVSDTKQSARGFRAYVKTCVVKLPPGSKGGRTSVGWSSFYANAGTHFGFAPYVEDGSHTWANLYPKKKSIKVGQCVQGWVPFEGVSTSLHVDRLTYLDARHDKAQWTAR